MLIIIKYRKLASHYQSGYMSCRLYEFKHIFLIIQNETVVFNKSTDKNDVKEALKSSRLDILASKLAKHQFLK